MITIQIDGKTYQFSNKDAVFTRYMNDEVRAWVKIWELEEVKENKESTDKCYIEDKTSHATDTHVAHSILEKLRSELERRINSEEWSTPYMEVKWELEEVLDFVNSLETKEQPTVYTSTAISDIWKCGGVIIEDKIELHVSDKWREQYLADHPEEFWIPEWVANDTTPWCLDLVNMSKQLELLTNVVRKLIANQ